MSLLVRLMKQRSEAIHAHAAAAAERAQRQEAIEAKAAQLRNRALWVKYRLRDLGPDQYYFLDRDSDMVRVPERGAYTLDEAEAFIKAREAEPVF